MKTLLKLLVVTGCIFGASAARAITVVESTDFPNNAPGAPYTLTTGANVFSGRITSPGDIQDRFAVVVPVGMEITSVTRLFSESTDPALSRYKMQGAFVKFNLMESIGVGSGTFSGMPLAAGTHTCLINANFAVGNPWSVTITVGNVKAVVTSVVGPAAAAYRVGDVLTFTANFNLPVNVTGVPRIALTIGSTTRHATYVSGSGSTALTFSYTVQTGDVDADGITLTPPINLPSGSAIKDLNATAATLTFTPPSLPNVRMGVPNITSVTPPVNGAYRAGHSLTFTANYSSPVTVTGVPQLAVVIGSSTRQATYLSGSGTAALVFTYPVVAADRDTDGIVAVSPLGLNSGTIKGAGNIAAALTFPLPDTRLVLVDNTPPSVGFSLPSASSTVAGPVTYTATFTDPQGITGTLTAGQFVLNKTGTANGTVSLTGTTDTATTKAVTLAITGITGDGTLSLSVPAGVVSDTVGNLSSAGGPGQAFAVGLPKITSVTPPGNSVNGAGKMLRFFFTYSTAVTVTGTPQLAVTIGTTERLANYAGGTGTKTLSFDYFVQAGERDLDGVNYASPVRLNGGTINDSVTAQPAGLTFTAPSTPLVRVDTTPPTITISEPSVSSTNSGTVTYTVTYADDTFSTSALNAGHITLRRYGRAAGTVGAVTGSGTTRTVSITGVNGLGALGIAIAAGTATDLAGNLAPALASQSFNVGFGGTLYVVGQNAAGQLGVGTTVNLSLPVPLLRSVRLMDGGSRHSLFVKADGTLWAMGSNDAGQLGDGTLTQRLAPVPVATNVSSAAAGGSTALAGSSHSLFLKDDGTLWGMGANGRGQLGDGTLINRPTPVLVAAGVKAFAAGGAHSLFLKTDNTLWAMGANDKGQLGDGTVLDKSTPVRVTTTQVAALSAGAEHSLYVTTTGDLYAMGANDFGQLGDNTSGALASKSTPVRLRNGVLEVAAGEQHSLFLTTGNTLLGMGRNFGGELGAGPGSSVIRQTPVQLATSVSQMAAGAALTLFIKTDGTLWGMGENSAGELGLGTLGSVTPAVQITNAVSLLAAGPNLAQGGHTLFLSRDVTGITSVTGPAAGTYKAGQSLSFTVTYSAAVTVAGLPQLPLIVGANARSASYVSGSGSSVLVFTYPVVADDNDLDGVAVASPLVLNSGTIDLASGGAAPLTFTPPAFPQVLVDNLAPTVTISLPPVGITNSGPVTYAVTYADNGTAQSTLSVLHVTLNKTGSADGTVTVGGTGLNRTVTLSGLTGDGTLGISLAAGTATDGAANLAAAAGPGGTFIVDNTPPTVTISGPSLTTTAAGPVDYTVTYADANFNASTLAASDLVLHKTGTADGTLTVSGTGLTRTVRISNLTGTGTVGISLAAGTASDLAGNLAPAAGPSVTCNVLSLNTAPTVAGALGDFTVAEDSVNVTANLTTVFADAETPATALTYAIAANTNTALVTALIANGTNLVMAFTADGNGTSQISVKATDAGGLSVTNTFVVTVTAVNDAPLLTLATNALVVYGDGAARTVSGFAAFTAGPVNEAGQTVSYTVTVDDAGLFSVLPAIAADGTLAFTPAARTNGATRVVVVARDSGGTANGGADQRTNVFTLLVQPAPGRLDAGYAPAVSGIVQAMAVQPDGKVLIGGTFATVNGQARANLARLNADGTLDLGFVPSASASVVDFLVQADGRIVVAGTFVTLNGMARSGLGRLNADGTLDAGFDPAPNAQVFGLVEQADGKLLVAGNFTSLAGQACAYLGRLETSGVLDATLVTGLDAQVTALAVQADGRLVLGGDFTMINGTGQARLARVSAAGVLDPGFAVGGTDTRPFCLLVQVDGKVVAGGNFSTAGGAGRARLARFNTDGTLDTGFNPGAGGLVRTMVQQADGKLLLGGGFTTVGGQPRARAARLGTDGTVDLSFNADLNANVISAGLLADGSVLLGGAFTTVEGVAQANLARLVNEPGTQALFATGGTQVDWQRGGTLPEPLRVTFEVSTDAGASWTPLGAGSRVAGGWQLGGLALPGSGLIRGRAAVPSGQFSLSAGLVEAVATIANSAPTAVGALADVDLNTGTPTATVALPAAFTDAETPAVELAYTVTGNTNLARVVATISNRTNLTFRSVPGLDGTSLVTVRATDVGGLFLERTVRVTVTLNQAPTLNFAQRVLGVLATDMGAQSVTGFATLAAGPAAEAGQTLGLTVTSDNAALFSAGPAVAADGTLTYTLASGASGSAVVTVVAMDNGGTALGGQDRTTNTFTISAVPANLVVTSAADSGPGSLRQVIANANASGGSVTILFAPGAGVTPLTPLPAFTGPVTLAGSGALPSLEIGPGGVLNLGGGTFTGSTISVQNGGTLMGSGTFAGSLVVAPGGTVAPGASPGQLTVATGSWEGGGTYLWEINDATGTAGTASDLLVFTGQLTVTATPANPFTVKLRTLTPANVAGAMANFDATKDQAWTIAQAGTVNGFNLAALRLDTAEVVNAVGNGGFALRLVGGAVQVTFTVNTAPTVASAPAPVVVLEDAPSTVLQLATSFADAQQAAGALTYAVTGNSASSLVTPTLGTGGALTLAYAPDQHGSATLTVSATDAGGLFAVTTIGVTVTPVNDAPAATFAPGTVSVLEDAGAQSLSSFATLARGPANESAQVVSVASVTSGNASLFSAAPAIDPTGRLTFTPAANSNGTATVTVVVQDNGGGLDRATNTFTIVVTSVNDAPVAVNDSHPVDQGDTLTVGGTGVLANDTDLERDPLTAERLTGPAHGVLALNADGSFTYTPDPSYFGPDTFTYRASDGLAYSDPATVTVTVAARPTNSVLAVQSVFANTTLRFSATNTPVANELRVGDPDSPTLLTVSLSVARGTVTVAGLGGIVFANGLTNGTNVVLTGSVADLNAALATLTYLGSQDLFGEDALVIVTTDEGGRTNRVGGTVPIEVQVASLSGVPSVSLGGLNNPATGLLVTNVVEVSRDTNLVEGISFDPATGAINVRPMWGQDGATNRTSLLVRAMFNDGTELTLLVPVIIYQPLLTSVSNYTSSFTTAVFNPQTSLFEQKVSVVNGTPLDFNSLRITATNLPAGVTLINASGTNAGLAYVEYNLTVRAGASLVLTLEYYSADRTAVVTPGLKLELLNTARVVTPPESAPIAVATGGFGYTPDQRIRFYLQFPTILGVNYYVQYQDVVDGPWKTSPVIVPGTGNLVNWTDDGAPNTDSPPGAGRFYRVVIGQ